MIWSVAGFLSVRGGVSTANRRAARRRARVLHGAERAAAEQRVEHPPARHRPLGQRPGRAELGPALGLDDAAAHGSGPPPARRTSRSRATCARRFPASASRRSTPRCRSAARSSRSGPSTSFTGLPINHVVHRRLRRVREADRRGRRHRRQRAGERSSRTGSTARTRRRRAASSGRAGGSTRACST